jgi:DNA-binding FadR family transcriptional regulator
VVDEGPPTEFLRIPRAAEVVAQHLRRQIIRGELPPGRSLAPEAELLARFGVSGPTLRAAYRVLEAEGLISVHRGARGGATVHRPSITVAGRYVGMLLQFAGTTLADLFGARVILEPPLAGLVAARSAPDAIAQLRRCLEAEEASFDDPAAFSAASTSFHATIVDHAGNRTVKTLLLLLWTLFEVHANDALTKDPTPAHRGRRRAAFRAHTRVTELIAAGESDVAELFWRTHMEAVGQLFARRYGTKAIYDLGT